MVSQNCSFKVISQADESCETIRNRASEPPKNSTEDTNHAMQQINELFQMNVVFPFSVEQMCCEVNDKKIE